MNTLRPGMIVQITSPNSTPVDAIVEHVGPDVAGVIVRLANNRKIVVPRKFITQPVTTCPACGESVHPDDIQFCIDCEYDNAHYKGATE
jgi:hypothetical protein